MAVRAFHERSRRARETEQPLGASGISRWTEPVSEYRPFLLAHNVEAVVRAESDAPGLGDGFGAFERRDRGVPGERAALVGSDAGEMPDPKTPGGDEERSGEAPPLGAEGEGDGRADVLEKDMNRFSISKV
jgi:hypothetical protein